MAAERLRDLSKPMDVALLDSTVDVFYATGSKEERAAADNILRDLKANPDTWLQVTHILQNTRSTHTKYFALQVLEGVIKYRWKALPVVQRDGMKIYISDVIVELSKNEASFRSERLYINKLNLILVQILKHEWPANWRSFIPDLVNAAKTSESICENSMAILKLLSEEIFNFSRGEMIQRKINDLKESLNSEFKLIHELCLYVLSASKRPALIRATLSALHAYLSWIPLSYIFQSPLMENLLKFFPVPAYRDLILQCLSKVAALKYEEHYRNQVVQMYMIFMKHLEGMLPFNINIPEAYSAGSTEEQAFIQNLALFFTSFFKLHINILETTSETIPFLLAGLEYLIKISYVDDTEVFKVCCDYWHLLVSELFTSGQRMVFHPPTVGSIEPEITTPKILYSDQLSKLRGLMITRMAKPEEVLIVEDENGNIVRETMKDSDVLLQYKIMRETLIFLTHFDHDDTERQMLSKLSKQINKEEWTWNNLSTLCWAIGSISGSMDVATEDRFLVKVIRALLSFSGIMKGNDNKDVIASNIMYVFGQYPRFLKGNWQYMMVIVKKLFDFMHSTQPGVKDMACDTFLKIAQQCKHIFLVVQVGKQEPFVSELLESLTTTIRHLEPHQIQTFYESVACIIQAESNPQKIGEYIERLMALPNQRWAEIIVEARQNVDSLIDPDVIHDVLTILQTNTRVAASVGKYFLSQISLIFLNTLNIYKMYSEIVSSSIGDSGPCASRISVIKLLRSVKREILNLIKTFLDKNEKNPYIGKHFVPPIMNIILADYARNVPDARESEVLSLFETIINQYKFAMQDDVPRIFESVFHCTLEMITKNFEDYPEHRLKFFLLLRAIATSCFRALLQLSSEQLKLVMDSVIWAFRHTERNIAETGLKLLLVLLKKFQKSAFSNQFYRTYFMQIEQEIIAVLTDTFHKPEFYWHVFVLQRLFQLVESGALTEPLWDASTVPQQYPNNAAFVCAHTTNLLSSSFPNISVPEVTEFVKGLYELRGHPVPFKNNVRDFLIRSKEFSAQDNKDLYAGPIAPDENPDEMSDS
ncbi:protein EXPORTIN 1B-like [Brassica napus]|uniref:protein EXPORTIN 1B-like n=1 Tax=Brassica napus TaxID=3708 RepID=UPI002078C0B3|nr:protein EXPORTIN 1B-like [Brassica napus]